MIRGVTGWRALMILLPAVACAADDPAGAARDLARRTAGFAGRGEAVTLAWRNASSLGAVELGQVRAAFENALKDSGSRISDQPASVEAHLTLSENSSQYLLVEEARKGEDRQVWIAGWKRGQAATPSTRGVSLEKKLVWEQEEPIL